MANSVQKHITGAELDAALAAIKAEQKNWFANYRRAKVRQREKAVAKAETDKNLRVAIWIGHYLSKSQFTRSAVAR